MFTRILAAFAALTVWTASAGADVRDDAKLFKPETVAKANAIIKEIETHSHHKIFVETVAELPKDKKDALEKAGKNQAERANIFEDWLEQEAQSRSVRGVFILISKSPGHVEVLPDRETRQKAFTTVDAKAVGGELREAFKEKKFDDGLISALESIRTTMEEHQGIRRAPEVAHPSHNPAIRPEEPERGWTMMGFVCLIGGIVLAFWVIAALIRAFTGMGRSMGGGGPPGYMGAPGYAGGGGGGFMSNFMGGMFGAVAGNWMYNNFFGGGQHFGGGGFDSPAYGGDRDADRGGEGDYSGGGGGGGDFGDQDAGGGAGGDFGGDDAGTGGDFGGGGGDFGGGGGDFGGGGGDF